MADESAAGPVRAFCTELGEVRRGSGRSLAGVAHELKMSRGHLYTILNGDVKRPPDWSRVVEPLLRACGVDDAGVVSWRGRHQVLEQVYEQLRRHQPPSIVEDALPVESPPRRRPWAARAARAAVVVLALGVGMVIGRVTAPERIVSAPAAPVGECAAATPAAGTNLLGLPVVAPSGDPHGRAWWRNDPRVDDPGDDPGGFTVSVRPGTQDPWDLLVVHSCTPIVAGQAYRLSFTASSTVPVDFTLRVQDDKPPAYTPSLLERVAAGSDEKRCSYSFRGALTSSESEVTFQVGGHTTAFRLTISEITLTVE